MAQSQRPFVPSTQPWTGTGRVVLSGPGRRHTGTAVVRRLPGEVRLALVADEGPVLVELRTGDAVTGGVVVEACLEDLRPAVPWLARIAWQTWGFPADAPQREGDQWIGRTTDHLRYYGGDPVLLRWAEGHGQSLFIGNWQNTTVGLLPHAASSEAGLGSVAIVLTELRTDP